MIATVPQADPPAGHSCRRRVAPPVRAHLLELDGRRGRARADYRTATRLTTGPPNGATCWTARTDWSQTGYNGPPGGRELHRGRDRPTMAVLAVPAGLPADEHDGAFVRDTVGGLGEVQLLLELPDLVVLARWTGPAAWPRRFRDHG